MREGQIIEGRGGLYTVRDKGGEAYVLRAKKKFRRQKISPLVGDLVLFTPGELEEHGWVEEILPRKSQFLRPPVANVDRLCIVAAPAPQPDWLLVDKLLLSAQRQQIIPLIVINKCDMDEKTLDFARSTYRDAQAQVVGVSARDGRGMDALAQALQGGLCCFAGQSGVGKSTLLSRLLDMDLETGRISHRIQRGRQTTRHASLLEANGIKALDTPGFSLLEAPDKMEPVTLPDNYPEFAPYLGQCRFTPCFHNQEPGCRVKEAAKIGEIDAQRLQRYQQLLSEVETNWRERYD